jgi:hypothetical protein
MSAPEGGGRVGQASPVGWVDGGHQQFTGDQQGRKVGRWAVVAALADQRGVEVAGGQRGQQRVGPRPQASRRRRTR